MQVEISSEVILEYLNYALDNLLKLKPKKDMENIDNMTAHILAEANLNAVIAHIEKLVKESEEISSILR